MASSSITHRTLAPGPIERTLPAKVLSKVASQNGDVDALAFSWSPMSLEEIFAGNTLKNANPTHKPDHA
jgi:hypothetical protein